jgi:hypothetical protein
MGGVKYLKGKDVGKNILTRKIRNLFFLSIFSEDGIIRQRALDEQRTFVLRR